MFQPLISRNRPRCYTRNPLPSLLSSAHHKLQPVPIHIRVHTAPSSSPRLPPVLFKHSTSCFHDIQNPAPVTRDFRLQPTNQPRPASPSIHPPAISSLPPPHTPSTLYLTQPRHPSTSLHPPHTSSPHLFPPPTSLLPSKHTSSNTPLPHRCIHSPVHHVCRAICTSAKRPVLLLAFIFSFETNHHGILGVFKRRHGTVRGCVLWLGTPLWGFGRETMNRWYGDR